MASDDYIKFIRFAQLKMDSVQEGIVGIITNHSWLDGPTFAGMRRSLLDSFHSIYVLDLHGNAKKVERAPDGGDDQNVFDIEQGVAISLFVKRPGIENRVYHAELWGKRLAKYESLAEGSTRRLAWVPITPNEPDWLFKPQDLELAKAYRGFCAIQDIFSPIGDPAPGIVTTHDQFAISFTPEEAKRKVNDLLITVTENEARSKFRLCSQAQWSYERAKSKLAQLDLDEHLAPVLYRPFDIRWTVWNRNVAVHRRERVMRHMKAGNIGLVTSRACERHTYRSDWSIPKTSNNGFVPNLPYQTNGERLENLSSEFRTFVTPDTSIITRQKKYSGISMPCCMRRRSRYAELLRMDFPRVPFPRGADDFEALSGLGWALIQAHSLRELPRRGLAAYHGRGDHHVTSGSFSMAEQAIAINKTQSFKAVPKAIWDFHIGGYQVLDKYLKSRKGRVLLLDEINHIGAVADSIAFTIDQIERIDEAYRAAFPEQP
jgi:predicted helicase